MHPLVIFICVPFLFSACVKPGTGDAGTSVYGVPIHYVDSSGNELYSLTDDGRHGFWKDSIKIYDITGTKADLPPCYETGLAYQFQQLDVMRTSICPSANIVNRYYYILIHLKNGVDDTLKVKLDEDHITPSTNNVEIWYNGVLDVYTGNGDMKIIK